MKKAILSTIAVVSVLSAGPSAKAEPVCYMHASDGTITNLNHLCAGVSAAEPVSSDTTVPVSSAPTEPFTIYTSEFVSEYMNACQTGAVQELKTLEGEGIYIPIDAVNPYCQCTLDSLQNTYTSQEAVAILEANQTPESMTVALGDIIDFCFQRVVLPLIN